MSCNKLLKIGKKFQFPDAPSSWVTRTVERIMRFQDHRPKHRMLFPSQGPNTLPVNQSTCWMLRDSNNVIKDGYSWYCRNNRQICKQFKKPLEEADILFNHSYTPFEKGEAFDVVSFLSTPSGSAGGQNSGCLVRGDGSEVEVESLRGKDVLVCCFFVPVTWLSHEADDIRAMITAFSEVPNLEVVVVAQMMPPWAHDQDAFRHFLSGFPSSWLAIPFSDTLRRHRVCKSLGHGTYSKRTTALFVDHRQTVVEHQDVDGIIQCCRPFCAYELEDSWWQTNTRLHSILDSQFVFKINNNNNNNNPASVVVGNIIDHENKVSVSVFDDKLVGLYLCCDGTLIRTLHLVSQECKARGQEFHIVLVYLPYGEIVDPPLFQEAVNSVLHKLGVSSNPHWWISPFNDYVSRTLWKVQAFDVLGVEDQLVILDPQMNVADNMGKYVINRLGINGYPFTRHFLVRRELEAIRALTLETLLVYGSRDYVLRKNNATTNNDNNIDQQVPIAELRGKNVLLYIDQVETPSDSYHKLLEWYNRNKTANVADFEVVFVAHFDGEVSTTSFDSAKPMPMPWLVCPFDPQHTNFVKEKILKAGEGKGSILAAFDKDGHIITLYAEDLLDSYGAEGFPSYDGLHNEVVHRVERKYHLNMDDLFDHGAPMRLLCLLGNDFANFSLYS